MTITSDTQAAANTSVVAAFIDELFTGGDPSAVERHLDPAFVDHNPPFGGPGGAQGLREAAAMMRAGCPDWHSDRLHMVAEGELVTEHFLACGTHSVEFFGVAATGNVLHLGGINLFRVRAGRIVERWGCLDELGFLRQLGLAPGQ